MGKLISWILVIVVGLSGIISGIGGDTSEAFAWLAILLFYWSIIEQTMLLDAALVLIEELKDEIKGEYHG